MTSAAAGVRDTPEQFRKPHVGGEIVSAILAAGPARILTDRLTTQFVRDAEPFARTELADSIGPIPVLSVADGLPIAGHVASNIPSNHASILEQFSVQ